MAQITHDSSILMIGGGTWGCGTALQLARRGFKNVTVLDAHPIPSPISAGNDVNKIMEEGKCLIIAATEAQSIHHGQVPPRQKTTTRPMSGTECSKLPQRRGGLIRCTNPSITLQAS